MTVPLKVRLLLADDHVLVRQGLRMVLDAAPDLEVGAEASDGAEAVEVALREEHLHLRSMRGQDVVQQVAVQLGDAVG